MCSNFVILTAVALFYTQSYADAFVFVSLKSPQTNVRVGPGKEYPVSWVFMKSNLPVILLAEFNQWRKIKFLDGTEGWVHQNMISRKNTAIIVTSPYAVLYRYESNSQPMAKIEKNVIVKVLKKGNDWIKVEFNGIKGWIKKQDLWGINEN
ncbi:MAG: SH3 domain-containing protein [Holosporaceae bacterium]|jgi:SH3-like domain-containing protein|nr:SH3 domain-containing protein [Holosporaceae bacterium]